MATPQDSHFIQTCVVRINGRREVYIPVFRQPGSSTLSVVDRLKEALPDDAAPAVAAGHRPEDGHGPVGLRAPVDPEPGDRGRPGAVLCSLVIFFFLGQWRMTAIAVLLIPLAVLAAVVGLYALGQTINVMTLAGLALAIGPLVDIAIVCLENTHRHLQGGPLPAGGRPPGASEVVMPRAGGDRAPRCWCWRRWA